MIRYRGVWGLGFVVAAILRMAFVAFLLHPAGHSTANAASAATDATRKFGDNPAEPIRDSFEDRFGSHGPKRLPTPVFLPGKPMMEPTPSR